MGQINGIDFKKAILSNSPKFGNSEIPYEQLLKQDPNYGGYIIYFKLTPVGLKHCIEKLRSLIYDNKLDFSKPNSLNDELYASGVNGITDYENLCNSLILGNSEITKSWQLDNGYSITLHLEEKSFDIYLQNLKDL